MDWGTRSVRGKHVRGEVVAQFPGVRETRTYVVMEEVKSDGFLPI